MPEYEVRMSSSRAGGTVRARLLLTVEAKDRDAADALVRDSLPGFDWGTWESAWGLVELTERPVEVSDFLDV